MGLAIAHEKGIIDIISEKSKRNKIGFFEKEFVDKLNEELKDYFTNEKIINWYKDYAVNYRDALAHRIPPYVPTAELTAEDSKQYNEIYEKMAKELLKGRSDKITYYINRLEELGKANPIFIHSFTEKAKPLALHPQLLADFLTVEEMVNIVIKNIDLTNAST